MKYYLIAGEASGDMHAANLMKAIGKNDPEAEFRCFGGDLMQAAGGSLFVHYRDMALMGIVEVLKKYPVIRTNKRLCRKDILAYNPDVLILVDYSGFNLPIARYAKKRGFRVFYYISPKLWAWAKWRIRKVRRYVDQMFVILPFEVDFYREHRIDAEYYGNPVIDSIEAFKPHALSYNDFITRNNLKDKPIVALLAGSRRQEIDKLLPEMLRVVSEYPDYQFVIAGAPSVPQDYYRQFLKECDVQIVYDQTYQLLVNASAAIVTSGTATLETALLGVPEVVAYKTSPVTFFIGSLFVRIKFFSLVNLILDEPVVKELLQKDLAIDIKTELDRLLYDQAYRSGMLKKFALLQETLGEAGVSERVAKRIQSIIRGIEE
ncbi:MAG: lipid-A-disaccharide synthase [Bacteroidales bacterium]|nr:lipid-A-disaccharide synthase [Bacteroidales bacterium]